MTPLTAANQRTTEKVFSIFRIYKRNYRLKSSVLCRLLNKSYQNKPKMTIDLYQTEASPNAMVVRLLAKALNINLKIHNLDMKNGEHLKPEFLKINPQHTVPTIVDDGFVIWESRAIMIYLIEKNAKDSSLYPKSPKARATINQRLMFDLGTLFQRFADYFAPIRAKLPADPEKLKKLHEALGLLNTFLEEQNYVAGNALTVADYSVLASIAIISYVNVDLNEHSNVVAWFERVKTEIDRDNIIEKHHRVLLEMMKQ